jgi:hypothetical protein
LIRRRRRLLAADENGGNDWKLAADIWNEGQCGYVSGTDFGDRMGV